MKEKAGASIDVLLAPPPVSALAMAVFDQFKNLIRHGKAAREGNRSFGHESSSPVAVSCALSECVKLAAVPTMRGGEENGAALRAASRDTLLRFAHFSLRWCLGMH